MKTMIKSMLAVLLAVVPALASGGKAMILVFQLVPGLVLFATMVKELFTRAPKSHLSMTKDPEKP